jgi:hypothetical protein
MSGSVAIPDHHSRRRRSNRSTFLFVTTRFTPAFEDNRSASALTRWTKTVVMKSSNSGRAADTHSGASTGKTVVTKYRRVSPA